MKSKPNTPEREKEVSERWKAALDSLTPEQQKIIADRTEAQNEVPEEEPSPIAQVELDCKWTSETEALLDEAVESQAGLTWEVGLKSMLADINRETDQ